MPIEPLLGAQTMPPHVYHHQEWHFWEDERQQRYEEAQANPDAVVRAPREALSQIPLGWTALVRAKTASEKCALILAVLKGELAIEDVIEKEA